MRKIESIINEAVAKKVAKKVAKEKKKLFMREFEEYILSQMLIQNKTRKEIIDDVMNSL